MSASVFCGLLCLLGLLGLLCGLVQLIEILAKGRVPLYALANDMALGLVMNGSVVALGWRLRQMRLRRRLSGHGGWPFGPRMSIVGGCHAYFWPCGCVASYR